ncbi:hypothetical protein DPMN_034196 [Dreissena polymorpha]|uniref:Uncharacterized protein n=1 Tax=Dreissena polymorpha TaxID=45954 RepID=A0A9D4M8I8_DREPO|nr:hypothetical protein DPMN_034196 [Dreissena polymorpha]
MGGHVFSPSWTIFELVRDINKTNVLNKFHDDWAKIVTSRVFTRNIAPPPGGHLHEDWASNVTSTVFTSFKLSRGINRTNVLTKFHEDLIINVASRVFTRQNVDDGRRTTHDGRRTTDKRRYQKLTMGTLCSGELKKTLDGESERTDGRSNKRHIMLWYVRTDTDRDRHRGEKQSERDSRHTVIHTDSDSMAQQTIRDRLRLQNQSFRIRKIAGLQREMNNMNTESKDPKDCLAVQM